MINRRKIIVVFVCLTVFILRYWSALPEKSPNQVGFYKGGRITVQGVVLMPPEKGEVRVRVQNLTLLKSKREVEGEIIAQQVRTDDIRYGDTVKVQGVLEEGRSTDPRLGGVMRRPYISVVAQDEGGVLSSLYVLRTKIIKRLMELFPDPAAGFAAGLLVGSRAEITYEVLQQVRRTGLTHVLALSGFNIVILITFISHLLGFLKRNSAHLCTLIFIVLFTILVGASASVVRAAVMGSLGLVAQLVGRPSKAMRSLWITCFVMAMTDPFIVIWDIGFQLSFAATAGLLLFSDSIEKRLTFLPEFAGIRSSLTATMAAHVFTLPIILYYFGGVSLIAPLANVLVLPFIPILMLGSFLSLIMGKIVAAPTYVLFKIVFWIIQLLAELPFAYFFFK